MIGPAGYTVPLKTAGFFHDLPHLDQRPHSTHVFLMFTVPMFNQVLSYSRKKKAFEMLERNISHIT